jgi:hypothetical protein
MNREDIIRIAQEAGLHIATDVNWMPIIGLEYAEKFAALVASAEREACAKLCAEWSDYTNGIAPTLAERIRARGEA